MSYDPTATAWIIPEPAPILSAWNPEAVAAHLVALIDPEYRQNVCQSGLGWFQRNHTSQRILADHVEVYRRLLADKPTLQFSSQNRKEAA